MKTYEVILSADAIVSATLRVPAVSPEDARSKALAMKKEDIVWNVFSLHESVALCGAVVYLNGKEVGEAEGK